MSKAIIQKTNRHKLSKHNKIHDNKSHRVFYGGG